MVNYCIFKDVNSLDLSLHMERLPATISAEERVTDIIIPGRNGSLSISENAFNSYTRSAEFVIKNIAMLDTIAAHFKGEGWITFSDEPDKKYYARVSNAIDFSKFARRWKKFIIVFHCQPFKYQRIQKPIVINASRTINNPGAYFSEPIITVTGTGNIVVGGKAYEVTESGVTINSEIQECYIGSVNKNNRVSGGFPTIPIGFSTISLGAGITSTSIIGNWRWF